MALLGRHRMRTHAGLPQGSTCALGADLQIYYQYNTGESVSAWPDASVNNNNASQSTADNQPAVVSGGGLDFDGSDDYMDFTSFNIAADTQFLLFMVVAYDGIGGTYVSDSNNELFRNVNDNNQSIKLSGAGQTIAHGPGTFVCNLGEKTVLTFYRDSSDDIFMEKSGLVFDPSINDNSAFDLQNLAVKNDAGNFYNGKIYELGMIDGAKATDKIREMITEYMCLKHGMERLG